MRISDWSSDVCSSDLKKEFTFYDAFAPGIPSTTVDKSWSNFGPTAGLNFKASDDVLLYASYSRGFRSGGFNGRASFFVNIGPYDVESVNAYEIGMKRHLFYRRVRLNLDILKRKSVVLGKSVSVGVNF